MRDFISSPIFTVLIFGICIIVLAPNVEPNINRFYQRTNQLRVDSSTHLSNFKRAEIDSLLTIPVKYHFLISTDSSLKELVKRDVKLVHVNFKQAYRGIVNFTWEDSIEFHEFNYSVDRMFADYTMLGSLYDTLVTRYSQKGYLNVFAGENDITTQVPLVLGFTPAIHYNLDSYERLSPIYDNVVISYDGLFKYDAGNTLIHEVGHWLGLKHPFPGEMTTQELELFGLNDEMEVCLNYMNYNCFTNSFTDEQKYYMKQYANYYRNYLAK